MGNPESENLPEGIGPHEGRELSLMLQGKKPLAMFFDALPECGVIPRTEFRPYVESGQILMKEAIYHPVCRGKKGTPLLYVYYAVPEEEWRIEAMHRIKREIMNGLRRPTEEDDQEIGCLLGYSEKDITRFLAWQNESADLV